MKRVKRELRPQLREAMMKYKASERSLFTSDMVFRLVEHTLTLLPMAAPERKRAEVHLEQTAQPLEPRRD